LAISDSHLTGCQPIIAQGLRLRLPVCESPHLGYSALPPKQIPAVEAVSKCAGTGPSGLKVNRPDHNRLAYDRALGAQASRQMPHSFPIPDPIGKIVMPPA